MCNIYIYIYLTQFLARFRGIQIPGIKPGTQQVSINMNKDSGEMHAQVHTPDFWSNAFCLQRNFSFEYAVHLCFKVQKV